MKMRRTTKEPNPVINQLTELAREAGYWLDSITYPAYSKESSLKYTIGLSEQKELRTPRLGGWPYDGYSGYTTRYSVSIRTGTLEEHLSWFRYRIKAKRIKRVKYV